MLREIVKKVREGNSKQEFACFAFECMDCSHTWVEVHYAKFADDYSKGRAKEDWGDNNSCPKCGSGDVGVIKESDSKDCK